MVAAPAFGQYHTYAQIGSDLLAAETNYPDICQRYNLGNSYQGREIWAICITDNVGVEEDEPEVKYISTMHGDEIMGVEMCMNLVDYLTTNYGSDPQVTNIVDSVELWIVPLMNPDGFILGQRYNAQSIDLNRNFPDIYTSPSNTPDGRATETQVIMDWSFGRSFTLAANYHGGALVANYPFDGNAAGQSVYTASPDDDLFIYISEEYTQYNSPMWNSPYYYHGITNGADWYVIYGGMQDLSYRFIGCNEITIEVSNVKSPPYSQIPTFWNENRDSMLAYIETSLIGARGLVTEASSGDPVAATVRVVGRDHDVFTDPDVGDYHRMLLPGTYDLVFEAEGYDPHLEQDVVVAGGDATRVDVSLWAGTDLIYPNGGETLTADSSTQVTWSGNPNAQFHVQYTDNAGDISSTTDGFESGAIGGAYTNNPDYPWSTVNSPVHQGLRSARAGDFSDGGTTELTRTLSCSDVSFWYQVSSESGWDFFRFYVDDAVVHSDSGTGGGWTQYMTTLDPGTHELKWEYSKDSNTTHGSDTVWIDDIRITADNTTWTDIVSATPVGATSASWTPNSEGSDYKARVRSVLGGGLYGQWDESASTFEVGPGQIPTVSEWGLVVLMLLICTAGSIVLSRQPRLVVATGTDDRGDVRRRNRTMTGTSLLIALTMGLSWFGAYDARGEDQPDRTTAALRDRSRSGSTPLHLAARSLRLETVRSLLDAGADQSALDRHGATALHLALRAGSNAEKSQETRSSLVDLFLERGADAKVADDQGKTPLHIAAMKGRAELLDRLVKAGAELTARDQFGRTPLHDAAMYNQLAVIEWLVAHEADVHAKDKLGYTPLHCAALRYRKEATEKLIELGASVDAKDNQGATPLHLTASEGPEEPEVDRMMAGVAEVLIAKGADVNAADRAGSTPLQYAKTKKRATLSTVLRNHGAVE